MWFLKKEIRYAVRSSKWPMVRKEYLKNNPCCEACGSCVKPEVHHIIPVHVDQTKELDLENLITLCDKYCHFVFGHFMNWKSWNNNIIEDANKYYQSLKNRP